MVHVLQFGQGNFLRTFADVYFDQCSQEGHAFEVTAVTAIPGKIWRPSAAKTTAIM